KEMSKGMATCHPTVGPP
ncbi:hypothetical protein A2U01_0068919, partial [Trifolium medium]|nr:hypothetical protein [Trifolium medium]